MTVALLAVHVVAAILLVGPITVAASVFPRYARLSLAHAGEVDRVPAEAARATALAMHRISRGYAVPALAVPVFGIGTAAAMGVLGDAWVLVSTALTLVAAVLLVTTVLPRQRRVLVDLPRSAGPTGGSTSGQGVQLRQLSMLTGFFSLLWVAVVVLMILRPGATTGV